MPNTTFADHPLHPQLITLPVALLPTSLALDLVHLVSGKPSHADAAYYTMTGALVGGAAAAVAGAGDYLSIPAGSRAKRVANLHAGLNLGILALTGMSVALRRQDRASRAAIVLSGICNAVALISQWYGGHLVYHHGMRVKDVNPIADAPVAKLPGDDQLAVPLERLVDLVPAGGPGPAPSGGTTDGRRPSEMSREPQERPAPVGSGVG